MSLTVIPNMKISNHGEADDELQRVRTDFEPGAARIPANEIPRVEQRDGDSQQERL